jgi:hypothetical protein
MQFTGNNLYWLRCMLERAANNVSDEIGSHPAPLDYPDDIDDLEAEHAKIVEKILKIDRELNLVGATIPAPPGAKR